MRMMNELKFFIHHYQVAASLPSSHRMLDPIELVFCAISIDRISRFVIIQFQHQQIMKWNEIKSSKKNPPAAQSGFQFIDFIILLHFGAQFRYVSIVRWNTRLLEFYICSFFFFHKSLNWLKFCDMRTRKYLLIVPSLHSAVYSEQREMWIGVVA